VVTLGLPGALEADLDSGELGRGVLVGKPRTHADNQPPFGDPVQCGQLVRQQDRVTQRGQQHRDAERDPLRARGRGGEDQQRVGTGPGHRAVTGPDGVESQRLSEPCLPDQWIQLVVAANGLVASREQIADPRSWHDASQ
jgi:hypothetical protein